jgi:glucose/arabinose dehydrogenase
MRQQLSVYVMAAAGYCGGLVCGPASVVAQTSTQRVAQATSPLFATAPPGDPNRLFIVEQGSGSTANIRVLNLETGDLQPTPFLTVRQLVTGGERGLLGLAFHPDFATNGLFYTNQTTPGTQPGSQDDGGVTNIVEWHVDGDPLTSDTANPAPVRTILTIDQPFQNHNGGWLAFSPIDRLLYIATGDGGSGNDPQNAGQRLNTLLAKMLRVDVNGDDFPEDDRNYVVPASNPFADDGDDRTLAEIWAYGLRNPFRSSFDRGDSTSGQGRGDLYNGDVGQNAREEINLQPTSSTGGENYGWRLREGTIATPQVGGARPAGSIDPIYDYSHGS